MTDPPRLAFGITAGRRPWLARLGAELEALGYDELWSNDVPGRSGLDTLAAATTDAPRLRLAVGVIPLSRVAPRQIQLAVRTSEIAPDRLTVGVGSGSKRSLAAVRAAFGEIRRILPGQAIGLAAVGPRMTELAGELADVVLLNWAGPELAAERRAQAETGARTVGRGVPRVAAYVRVAVGSGARERVAAEQARYLGYGGSYARVITAQTTAGLALVGVAEADPPDVPAALARYRPGLDTVVVRGLPAEDSLEAWLAVARAATLRP